MEKVKFLNFEQRSETEIYRSTFSPSVKAEEILRNGNILAENETPQQMIERMVVALFSIEEKFGTSAEEIRNLSERFGWYADNKYCVMSTPVMNNAGRYPDKPLSACTVPPIDLRNHLSQVKELVDKFHEDGMGTGFNLDDVEDPVKVLRYLNEVALEGAHSGREDRPVGNMAVLSVNHPRIMDFINAKTNADELGENWKFNISVNVGDGFMDAVENDSSYQLLDGTILSAKQLLMDIVTAAYKCGDPGLAFIERMNRDNPTPVVGAYATTAPCAEVGLTPGESCQFGYLNLSKFVTNKKDGFEMDWEELEKMTRLMTRTLDNALEISIGHYPDPINDRVMSAKRKIGVGVCGLADLFIALGIPYDSENAKKLSRDIVAFVNYQSKLESHELARTRGSFGAMRAMHGCRYNEDPGFIAQKYGKLKTAKVTAKMWLELDEEIRETKMLRNASTIALPPTGRSGLIIDANPGIEPIFSLVNYDGTINASLVEDLRKRGLNTEEIFEAVRGKGSLRDIPGIPEDIRNIYKTAVEISPETHILMSAAIQEAVDESISKTINMPRSATPDDIFSIYVKAYRLGLKGITIFRTGSRKIQPRKLAIS